MALLAVLAVALPAAAAVPPTRQTGLHFPKDGWLRISVGVQDIIPPGYGERLTSGFATSVLIRVAVFRADGGAPVAQAFRHSQIVYDLWEEKFRVTQLDGGGAPRDLPASGLPEALALATTLVMFPVAEVGRLEAGVAYRLSFRADLNPLNPDAVAEVRRWLVRPPAQGRLGPGDTFFGSFVSIFVNPNIEDSERRIEFLSQPFVRPPAGQAR